MSAKQPAIALLGSVVSESLCQANPACHPAGNMFQLRLIQALRQATGCAPAVFSVQPVGAFPKTRQIWVAAGSADLGAGVTCQFIPFLNLVFVKQASIALANLLYLLRWLWHHRSQSRCVLVYNVYPPMAAPVLAATRLLGGKAVAVVLDLPHNLSFDFRGLRGLLQRLDFALEGRSLRLFSGIVGLTRYIGEDFAPRRPSIVMEAGVDPAGANQNAQLEAPIGEAGERICLFSGTLNQLNGVELLIEAFSLIPQANYRLWIFGRGPLEPVVKQAAAQDARIIYGGFVTHSEVQRHQQGASVLLNIRPSQDVVNRYTFPSKLVEYMLSGRPVITTLLPGIPDEYYPFLFVLRDESPASLARLLQEVLSKPPAALDQLGQKAQAFVLESKDWRHQGKRIYEFISSL